MSLIEKSHTPVESPLEASLDESETCNSSKAPHIENENRSQSYFPPGRIRGESRVLPETFDPEAEEILIRERQKLALITGIEVPDPLAEFPNSPPHTKLHHHGSLHHHHYTTSPPLSPIHQHHSDTSPRTGPRLGDGNKTNQISDFSLDEQSNIGNSIDDFIALARSSTFQSFENHGTKGSGGNLSSHGYESNQQRLSFISPSPSTKVVKRLMDDVEEPSTLRLSTQHRLELGLIPLPLPGTVGEPTPAKYSTDSLQSNELMSDSTRSGRTSKGSSSVLVRSLPRPISSHTKPHPSILPSDHHPINSHDIDHSEEDIRGGTDTVSTLPSPTSGNKTVLEMLKTRRRSLSADGLSTKFQSPVSDYSTDCYSRKDDCRSPTSHGFHHGWDDTSSHQVSRLNGRQTISHDILDSDEAPSMSRGSSARHSMSRSSYQSSHFHCHDDHSDRQRASFRLRSSSPERQEEERHSDSSHHFRSKPSHESLFSKLFHLHTQQNRRSSNAVSSTGDDSHPTSPRHEFSQPILDTTNISQEFNHDGRPSLSPIQDAPHDQPWEIGRSYGSAAPTDARPSLATSPMSGTSSADGSGTGQDCPNSPKEEHPHKLGLFRSSITGSHKHHQSHHLTAGRRQTRERSDSAGISSIFKDLMSPAHHRSHSTSNRKSVEGELDSDSNAHSQTRSTLSRTTSDGSLAAKYGRPDEILGKGAFAVVRLAHHKSESKKETLYAVKEYRKRRKEESEKDFAKRLIAEFCISSSMHHENVVHSVDLVQSESGKWCQIMEYCPGGDLHHKANTVGFSSEEEIHCIFRQLLNGIAYIHSNGVAHRDLKMENVLLDVHCRIIKITDFGVSAVFKTQFEKESRLLTGCCGSGPYIAPEEWDKEVPYHPTKVDIWAIGNHFLVGLQYEVLDTPVLDVGMMFISMLNKSLPWSQSQITDEHYATYLRKRDTGYPNFEKWFGPRKQLLYTLLDPDPLKRPEAADLIQNDFVRGIKYCTVSPDNHEVCIPGNDHIHLVAP